MGGDEFVIVLNSGETETTRHKIAKLSVIVAQVAQEVCGERLLAVSIGAPTHPQNGATH